MTHIKVHEEVYVVELRNWNTYELPEKSAVPMKHERARKNKQCVLLLGDDAVDWFEVRAFYKKKVTSETEAYILSQAKLVRDKLNTYAAANKIIWNNIAHVSNVIDAIHRWEL